MFLAQIANTPQLPELPKGPSLDRVRGPIEIPTYEPWQIVLAAFFVVLLLGAIAWLILKSRRNTQSGLPPYEAAIAELDAATALSDQDQERFAVLCSQALRRYLEDALGLKFSARTSEEFLRSLKGNTVLEESYQGELEKVLAAFDRIKFAREEISEQQCSEISNTVRSLIDQANKTSQTEGGTR